MTAGTKGGRRRRSSGRWHRTLTERTTLCWPRRTGGWRIARRALGELAAHVEQVVPDLVLGVDGDPPQRPLARLGKVVDDGALPVVGAEPVEDVDEQSGRV